MSSQELTCDIVDDARCGTREEDHYIQALWWRRGACHPERLLTMTMLTTIEMDLFRKSLIAESRIRNFRQIVNFTIKGIVMSGI